MDSTVLLSYWTRALNKFWCHYHHSIGLRSLQTKWRRYWSARVAHATTHYAGVARSLLKPLSKYYRILKSSKGDWLSRAIAWINFDKKCQRRMETIDSYLNECRAKIHCIFRLITSDAQIKNCKGCIPAAHMHGPPLLVSKYLLHYTYSKFE